MTLLGAGCAAPFWNDGTSLSVGPPAEGSLRGAAVLPHEGDEWVVPMSWRERKSNYATDEVVAFVARVARRVGAGRRGVPLMVGDLSRRGGGSSAEHRSHGSGRDVDLFFFAVDAAGRPHPSGDAMIHFGPDGKASRWSPAHGHAAPRVALPVVRFDVRRNWALVRALLTDSDAEVQWIFIERALGTLLLDHAAAIGEDPDLRARAALILHQPTDSQPHDDHIHVRIFCDVRDRALGCSDRGPQRWWKKRWKWMAVGPARTPEGLAEAAEAIVHLIRNEVPRVQFARARS